MCREIELLVVIDAEGKRSTGQYGGGNGSSPAHLRREEPRRHAREYGERRESMEVRHAYASRVTGNLRPLPFHWKRNRRVTQDAEVVSVVRVLPDVLAGEHQVFAEGLLQPDMEFVAPAGSERCHLSGLETAEQRVQYGVIAALAREHKVFVEWCLQHAGIRRSKHRTRLFDFVGEAQPWFG